MSTIHHAGNDDAVSTAIEVAEEVCDPLDGLAEKTAADPGAAFAPEVLERLVALKRDNRAAFEALRAQLKKVGCWVTCFTRRTAPASPTSTSTATAKPGR